jgi:FkbM family methyltransferase
MADTDDLVSPDARASDATVNPRGLSRVHSILARVLRGPLRSVARFVYRPLARRFHITLTIDGKPVRFRFGSEPPTQGAGIGPLDLRRFAAFIQPGFTVADVGAHVGTFSVIAGARVGPAGRVFSFEPAPESRRMLQQNIGLNRFEQRVTIVPAAVSDQTGQTVFYIDGKSTTNSLMQLESVSPTGSAPQRAITVGLTTLDDFFASIGRDPDLVKIDVEGAEFAVLRGADRILRGPARVLCELHPYAWTAAGHDGHAMVQWLKERGRRIVALDDGKPLSEFRYGVTELVRSTEG